CAHTQCPSTRKKASRVHRSLPGSVGFSCGTSTARGRRPSSRPGTRACCHSPRTEGPTEGEGHAPGSGRAAPWKSRRSSSATSRTTWWCFNDHTSSTWRSSCWAGPRSEERRVGKEGGARGGEAAEKEDRREE